MRAVNHDSQLLVLVLESLLGSLDVLLVKVGTLGSATEDDEAVLVTLSSGNGSKALLGDTHEVMLSGGGANSINGNAKAAVSAVLEAYGEGEARGQLTVELGFGGTGTNGTYRDAVGKELRRDGVEHLGGNRHALVGKVGKELSRDAETLVDLERVIDIGIIDESLPANSRSGLLEVGAHHDAQVIGELVGELLETGSILMGGGRVVDGAGTDDDEKSVAGSKHNVCGIASALDDSVGGLFGQRNLGGEESRGDQRILTQD